MGKWTWSSKFPAGREGAALLDKHGDFFSRRRQVALPLRMKERGLGAGGYMEAGRWLHSWRAGGCGRSGESRGHGLSAWEGKRKVWSSGYERGASHNGRARQG